MTKDDLKALILSDKNKSGKYSRESTWKTLYPDLYNDLLSWVFPGDFTFKQKIYHYLNNDHDLVLGRCVDRGKRCEFKNSVKEGYHHFCSLKCSSNSSNVREKKKQT